MTYAIEVDEVHKRYGDVHAVRGLSFQVEQGEFFGLLGPNGAGKSTLINMASGLVRASSGHIRIQGHDVERDYRQARRQIGVVPQEVVFDPFFTVREALELQLGYMGLARTPEQQAWLDELLDVLDLQGKANSRVKALSGGMKRRVLIAQALVHRPPVVVLDEPTAGVDVELRQILWRFAQQLHADGHTIVLTTHYLEEAESLCDRIAIINHGELQALESKRELINRHPYRLLNLWFDGDVSLPSALEGKRVAGQQSDGRTTLKLHKTQDNIGDVIEQLRGQGAVIQDLETDSPGLEEVFIEMTQRPHKQSQQGGEQ
ncbi:abc-type transporter, atpase component, lose family [gamma proteobacterium HTCC5015]|nr:abc-type transporter, atpase component, lose family [gamma proteobacterium HTCC5015]